MIEFPRNTAHRVAVWMVGLALSSLIAGPGATAQDAGRPLRLVEGRFGQAIDAGGGGFLATADPRFARLPLTVELWAKLADAGREAILLSSEGRDSGTHWELVAEKGTGALVLRVPGYRPPRLSLNASLADGRWHHVAIVRQEGRARAFFDGKACLDAALARTERPSLPSGLGIGTAVEDRRPNPVLIDDVRVSSSARDVVAAPSSPLVADEHTIALWSFDESDDVYLARWTPGGETNQRGLPYPHRFAEYEFEKDEHWVDGRWQQTDKGPFVTHSILVPRRAVGPKGIAVFLDRARTSAVLFDPERCAAVAGLTGARLTTNEFRYGLLRKPTLAGALQFYVPPEKTWRKPGPDGLVPLGRDEVDYRGLHLHGDRVLLSYRVLGGAVLDLSTEERRGEVVAIARHLEIDSPADPPRLTAAEMPVPPRLQNDGGVTVAVATVGEVAHAVALVETTPGGAIELRDRDVMLRVPPGARWKGQILSWSGPKDRLDAFAELARSRPDSPALDRFREPGPGRWGEPLVTRGKLAEEAGDAPYVIDTIAVPYENPYKALFFISALDFFPNGDAALATVHGDVWLVRGLDRNLGRVTWQRFATGLYQPLGVKVVDGRVLVLGRDQITRLHDRNGDGEADEYESFNHDLIITGRDHAFALRLEADSKENLYFLHSGDPGTPHGSSLLRVSPDGRSLSIFARGFRHPNGLGVGPGDEITVADNEGNWVPSSKIDLIREGGFYGFLGNAREAPDDLVPERPLCFIPKVADNSCGGQAWYTGDRWGDYHRGGMLHLSWGRCTLHAVLRDKVGDVWQAATVRFSGLTFLSGPSEGAFHPVDGQLYVVGLDGWQTAAAADGSFQRVRSTGKPIAMPESFHAREDGVVVGFSRPLDPVTAADPRSYRVERWNYRWSSTYGSFHYAPDQPDRIGHDPVKVEAVQVLPGGKEVFLKMPGLRPVDQLHLHTDLQAADGKPLQFDLYATLNTLGPASGAGPAPR